MNGLANLKQRAKQLLSESQVLMIAYRDKRTPIGAKLLIGLTVGYLLSPIDLIPDFIPVLGWLDDLLIVPLLITWSLKSIPAAVLTDARKTVQQNPSSFRKNNWLFAMLIVLFWLFLLYVAYRHWQPL